MIQMRPRQQGLGLKAGVQIDPAPQGKLKKINEDRDDGEPVILSVCYWSFLSMTHDSFVLLTF